MNNNKEPTKDKVEYSKEQRDFVEKEKMEKYLTCPICTEIFDNPIRISCGHTFCDDCLSEWGKKSNNFCPLCRKKFYTEYSGKDLIAQSIINDALVHCIHKGCPWKDKLSNLKSHIHTCIFDPAHLPEFIKKGNKLEEKKNEDYDDVKDSAENLTSFNVNSSLKERIFARNPELVASTYSNIVEERKEEDHKEIDDDGNEIVQLPRSELPYRARRGRPKANHRPIFAVHTDVRNYQRNLIRNNNSNNRINPRPNNQRNNLSNSSNNNEGRMNSLVSSRSNLSGNPNNPPPPNPPHRGPGRPRDRKNGIGITFNQSLINPNVNHIINPSPLPQQNINHNSRAAPGPLALSNAPRPVQRNNNINNSNNNLEQNINQRPAQRINNIPRPNSINNIRNHNQINSLNKNNNSINSNHSIINHNHNLSNHNLSNHNLNNHNLNSNNQRINSMNSFQRLNQQQKNNQISNLLINQQRNLLKNNNPLNLNNSQNKSKNIPLNNSQGNIRLNHTQNHLNNHQSQNKNLNSSLPPLNAVLNDQIERILEMNSGKTGKDGLMSPNKNINNKMNGINGIKNNQMNGIKNNKNLIKNGNGFNLNNKNQNDPQDIYQIISQSVNGVMDGGMNKKNAKRKMKVNKDDDFNDFKLLGRKRSNP